MSKTPEQTNSRARSKSQTYWKSKNLVQSILAERADKKVIIFDMLVDMAEKEYDIQIRKNYKPGLSTASKKNKKKQ